MKLLFVFVAFACVAAIAFAQDASAGLGEMDKEKQPSEVEIIEEG